VRHCDRMVKISDCSKCCALHEWIPLHPGSWLERQRSITCCSAANRNNCSLEGNLPCAREEDSKESSSKGAPDRFPVCQFSEFPGSFRRRYGIPSSRSELGMGKKQQISDLFAVQFQVQAKELIPDFINST